MPVPTHRADCQTRIGPTQCPHCQADIYFFSCSCGSKVFMQNWASLGAAHRFLSGAGSACII